MGYKVKKIFVGTQKIRPVKLPSAYQEVEYIASSGTQYIDTGLAIDLTHVVKYEGSFNYSNVSTRQLNGVQGFRYIGVIGGYYQIANSSSNHENVSATANQFNEFSVTFDAPGNKLSYSIEGTNVTKTPSDSYTYTSGQRIAVFSLNSLTLPSSCKIAYWKIYIDNVLTRDLVPCYRKSDSVIGLYDSVNNQFYTNAGTGTFTKGPDVN